MTEKRINLPGGKVVRIKEDHWLAVQRIALVKSIEAGCPVKESEIIHQLLEAAINSDLLETEDKTVEVRKAAISH